MDRRLGTFLGVYTPTILTILGVIMYLRFGWLVGELGLGRVLTIVVLANAITLTTTLSFSAVATNTTLGTGGAYYIVSRSLGIELGGAIGLPLFLCQALSVTLYAFGLAESLRFVWPGVPLAAATLVVILAVGLLAHLGARHALKAQVPLLALVGLSLAALAVGALLRAPATGAAAGAAAGVAAGAAAGAAAAGPGPAGALGFWAGFAVFFPAVTGVMAGLGLSGDLRDPGRAIPLGALAAVLTGLAVYLAVPILLARGADPDQLRGEPLVWTRVAVLGPWLVLPGLWGAIFSSAVGSLLGAPRTLLALAQDGLAPRRLARPAGADGQPDLRLPLLVSLAIALLAVRLGDLNAVASVVTVFFLTVYGTINLVAAFEALSGDPSWRPRLRAPWPLSLAGGLACGAVVFLISPVAGLAALVVETGLWLALSRREQAARWGDVRRGLYESLVRWALVRLREHPMSARSWRPHALVFVEDPLRELDLVRFGFWFSQGRGVVTVCRLVVGDLLRDDVDLVASRRAMQEVLDAERLTVFAEVDMAADVVDGITEVAQANGMAGLTSNTVLLGWPSEPGLRVEFLRVLRRLERLHKSLVLGRIQPRHLYRPLGRERLIHVWWGGLQRNGDLMLLLAYLLTRNPDWRDARVEVLSLASSELMKGETEQYLGRLLPALRLDAAVRVLQKPREASVAETIRRESAGAEVVFLGLATPEEGREAEYAERLETLAGDLPTVFFVKNASMFVGELLAAETERPAGGQTPTSASHPM